MVHRPGHSSTFQAQETALQIIVQVVTFFNAKSDAWIRICSSPRHFLIFKVFQGQMAAFQTYETTRVCLGRELPPTRTFGEAWETLPQNIEIRAAISCSEWWHQIVVQYTHLYTTGYIEVHYHVRLSKCRILTTFFQTSCMFSLASWHHGPNNKPTTLPRTLEARSTFQYKGM